MSLSKAQAELDPKLKFMRFFWLQERDILECARRWEPWRVKARELGFTDAKIDAPWTHADAGRLIRYAEIKGPVLTDWREDTRTT